MDCSDPIVLQRLFDADLDPAHATLVSHHLAVCARCRSEASRIAATRSFVLERLGAEDEGEEDAAAASLAIIASRLPPTQVHRYAAKPAVRSWWIRPTWLAAAGVAILSLLLPLAFGSHVSASADRILEEAVVRERIWSYQPDKVLHWEVEAVSTGIKGLADGPWRSVFWQNNGETTFSQIWRQFDPRGQIYRATWRREDGSLVDYRPNGRDVVEVLPSSETARAALPSLLPELRAALDAYLDRRESLRSLDLRSRREAEWLNRPAVWTSRGQASLRRGTVAEWGEVYHITVVNARTQAPTILRAVHEYEVEKSSYRLLRLKSTLTYADGTTGIHDSRWVAFREASEAEFEEHAPRELLSNTEQVVHLTPLDVATRHLQELNRARTAPD